ncbi:hypothetical protein ACPXAT_27285, partial [Klebsiella pneumoniae]
GAGSTFENEQDALKAYEEGKLHLNTPISVNGVETSPGRLLYTFSTPDEAILAVDQGVIDYQDHVRIRLNGQVYETSA